MPTYDYQCKKCDHQFELFQSITAEPLKTCPAAQCPHSKGRGRVQRLIGTGGGLLFKGSGFYITDYRSDGYNKAAKADKDSSSGGDSGSKEESKKSGKESTTGEKGSTTKDSSSATED